MTRSEMVALADVCEINPRLSKAHPLSDDTDVSFVPMAALDETEGAILVRHVRPFSEVKKGYTSFRDNDVLLAKITPCMENGKAAVARDLHGSYGFGSTEFHVLRATPRVLPEWIFYFVRREPFRAEAKRNFTGTAGQQRVPSSFLQSVKIPLPLLPEQRRIVDILSRAESIVRLRREAQKKVAELIPALFLDTFGDPTTNPKGWPVASFGSVAEVQGGLQVTKARAPLPLEQPYLRVANVHRSRLDLSEIKSIRLTLSESARTKLFRGDLLLVEGHGNPLEIGRVAIWDGSIHDCVHQNHLIRARCNPNHLSPAYACEYLNSSSGRRFLLRSGKTTSGLTTISVGNVRGVPMLLPPISSQAEFEANVDAIRAIQTQQSTATTQAEATFNALLAQVFAPV